MPHAPLLLEEVAGPTNAAATAGVAAAVRGLDLSPAGLVVVASPHGPSTGVYARTEGSLDAFGPRGIDVSEPGDDSFAHALARAWDRPVLDRPADHGVVVPLRLLPAPRAAVAVAFDERLSSEEAAAEGEALARAIRAVAAERTVAYVASANLSAGVTERAPLPSLDGAADADAAVLSALERDPGTVAGFASRLCRAGSCAAGPLGAFGALFAGRGCEVLAYEHPFGVGYAVAATR